MSSGTFSQKNNYLPLENALKVLILKYQKCQNVCEQLQMGLDYLVYFTKIYLYLEVPFPPT